MSPMYASCRLPCTVKVCREVPLCSAVCRGHGSSQQQQQRLLNGLLCLSPRTMLSVHRSRILSADARFCSGIAAIYEHKFLFLSISILSSSQHIHSWRWHREVAVKSAHKDDKGHLLLCKNRLFSLAEKMGMSFYCVQNIYSMVKISKLTPLKNLFSHLHLFESLSHILDVK